MRPESRTLLNHALGACDSISRFVRGLTWDDYAGSDLVRSAVERQFEIVGEAIANLRKSDAGIARRIPDLTQIVALRNLLIHRYVEVDDRVVWSLVEGKLSALRAALQGLLAQP